MKNLSESFKDCETLKLNEQCPRCKRILYRKRLRIDTAQFKSLRKIGILFKAVDFCINPDCNYLEQGVLYFDRKNLIFLNLKEIDRLILNKLNKSSE